METTLRVNTERVCIINDGKDFEEQDSPKVIFINPEGRREHFEGRDYTFCKSSNVWQVKIDNGKKYSYFKNPKNFDGHVFIHLNEKTMKYSMDEESYKLIQCKLEVEEVEMFLRELNKTLHIDNNITVITKRSKVISFMGWFFFSLLMISAFGILGAGIYTSQIKSRKIEVEIYNKFASTYEAPFYLISFFIIVMAVVIYFSCVKNAILKDYHTQKLQFTLYKNKVKAIENKFNRNYFSKKGCYASISPSLEYVHFSLKSEILKIIDLF
jgi:hypothetical protein